MAYKKNDYSPQMMHNQLASANGSQSNAQNNDQLLINKQKSMINSSKLQTLKKDKGKIKKPEVNNNDHHDTIKSTYQKKRKHSSPD